VEAQKQMKDCNTLLKDKKKTEEKRLMKQSMKKLQPRAKRSCNLKGNNPHPAKGIGSDWARNEELT